MHYIVFVFAIFMAMFPVSGTSAQESDTRPAVVFIGSSSIAKWTTLERDFPEYRVINRGVVGSAERPDGLLLPELLNMVDSDVVPYAPKYVVVYAGENDLWKGATPDDVMDHLALFRIRVHQALPSTRIIFISIKPSPMRWNDHPEMTRKVFETNRILRDEIEDSSQSHRLRFADVLAVMLGADGNPRQDLFMEDGLHLSRLGYGFWKNIVRNALY